jgi:hypothetical protein
MSDPSSDPGRPWLAGNGGLYVTGEDNLRISSYGSVAGVTVAIEGRMLDCDGRVIPIADSHTPNSDRTVARSFVGLREGWLTSIQARIGGGTARRGQVFVVVELVRGRTGNVQPLGTLIQGYAGSISALAWPGSPIVSSVDGPGVLRSIAGANPAVGAEISETVPAGTRWRLVSFTAVLVTSAVAGNRFPAITIDDGVNTLVALGANVSVGPSGGGRYTWGAGAGAFGSTANGNLGTIPDNIALTPGYRLRTSTTSLDAGDDWSAPQYLVEEWIEP